MKPRRMFTMTAAGVIIAGALIGATATGQASASETTYHPLCVDSSTRGNECIVAPLVPGAEAGLGARGSLGATWLYPDNGQTNYIHATVMMGDMCLQVDAHDGYVILGNTCVGDSAEAWQNEYDSTAHRTIFISKYNPNLCLTADYNDGILKAETCTHAWYQEWGTS